jgi:hypothetical protein
MTSYDSHRDHATDLLQCLTGLLADEVLQQRIDEPIDDAAVRFKCPQTAERSKLSFIGSSPSSSLICGRRLLRAVRSRLCAALWVKR